MDHNRDLNADQRRNRYGIRVHYVDGTESVHWFKNETIRQEVTSGFLACDPLFGPAVESVIPIGVPVRLRKNGDIP